METKVKFLSKLHKTEDNYVVTMGEPQKTTICAKCKNKSEEVFKNQCHTYKLNLVTGEQDYVVEDCRDKNHGNCPDYLLKEQP